MVKKNIQNTIIKHKTKRSVLIRFSLVLLVFIAYFAFVSYHYGAKDGILVTFLTWSFFVFCTPIADAGFLLDFPIRLLTKIRMIHTEILTWIIAASVNIYSLIFQPSIYQKTGLLKIFQYILTHPIPFWLIIIISCAGTFLSVYFGDELMDITNKNQRKKYKKHKSRYLKIIITFILALLVIIIYIYLIEKLNINIKIW